MTTLFQATEPNASFRVAQRTPVSVGGKVISAAAIAREMQNHEAASPLHAWQAAARALIVREMLLQEARRLGLEAIPLDDGKGRRETMEEALIRSVLETQVKVPEPDEASCRRYYEHNLHRFRSPDLYSAAHILLAAHPDDAGARAAARDSAAGLIAILKERPEEFERLAAQHSACPSAKTGGNLGQLKKGDTVPEFDDALAAITLGEIAGQPVETRYGFHIVQLEHRIDGCQLPFTLVAAKIADYLRERSMRIAAAQYLAMLAMRTEIDGARLPQPADVGTG